MKESILITGINGFVGEHVAREFKSRGFSVSGVGHQSQPAEKVSDLIDSYVSCNLLDEEQVNQRLPIASCRAVIHLASLANVGESFDQPRRYMTDNGVMVHNLLQRTKELHATSRIIVVSTGALYDPNQPQPLNESSATRPNSPYAIGKLMAEDVVEYYRLTGLDAVVVRPFNHIGPGQGLGFILPDFYKQLIESQENGEILVGNINTKRDYTDVRDIARAYGELALASTLNHSTYNICSGISLSGREILEYIQDEAKVGSVTITIDPDKVRPTDISEIRGDASRLQQETGWKPEIPIQQTIRDYIDFTKTAA